MGSSSSVGLSAETTNSEFNFFTQKCAAGEIQFLTSYRFKQISGFRIDFVTSTPPNGVPAAAYFSERDLANAKNSYTNGF